MRREPIVIVASDPAWPALFAEQRDVLQGALAPWVVGPIEHIGSTAVAGLSAKLIIDMLARCRSYEEFDGALKTRLAGADPSDRSAYRAAKGPFIEAVIADARRGRRG